MSHRPVAGGKTCHCITSGKDRGKANLLTVVCRMDSQLLELLCPKSHQICRLSSYREMRKRIKNTKKAPSPLFRYSGEVTRTLQLAVHFPHYLFVTVQHFHHPRQYDLKAKKRPPSTRPCRDCKEVLELLSISPSLGGAETRWGGRRVA